MGKRIGIIGILIFDRKKSAKFINEILSNHGDIIVGRIGVPYRERKLSVISLIVDGTTDEIGSLTGKLGMLEGVRVRSAIISD